MNKGIEREFKELDKLQTEILEENQMLVRSFFSVCVFDGSDTELEKADKRTGKY